MQPEVHFAKGERFEQAQAKLAPATDWELAIEDCYYAAFQFILLEPHGEVYVTQITTLMQKL